MPAFFSHSRLFQVLGARLRIAVWLGAGLMCSILGSAEETQPQLITPSLPSPDLIIAEQVVQAPRDGQADATAAIQAAIDSVAKAGGGVVFLPAGHYLLKTGLLLREGVTLRGEWARPAPGQLDRGTVLQPVGGKNSPDDPPAVMIENGTGLRELTIWYPEQNPAEPVPYPWTIRSSEKKYGDNYTIYNCTLVNPYRAVKIGPHHNELHTLRNVFACPLKKGLEIDSVTDIGRLTDVSFSPRWWCESGFPGAPSDAATQAKLRDFLRREAVAVDIARSDWEYIYRLQVDGYQIGLNFTKGVRGITNAVMFASDFTNCQTALRADYLNKVGLSATGCRFAAVGDAVVLAETCTGLLQLNTCTLESQTGCGISLESSGTVSLQNCEFDNWGDYALKAAAGEVAVVGTLFKKTGQQVALGEKIACARLVSNVFTGGLALKSEAPANVVLIDSTAHEFSRPDISPSPAYPEPRPATEKLFVATAFGAAANNPDNTAALTRALSEAGSQGGGTVYLPAGKYVVKGTLTVPGGVELRGCFDVPHHTQSGGSVLLTTQGRGQETGEPFIKLSPGSGLRGLTFWYPEQNLDSPIPYPWTIRSEGPGCWLTDVTIGNAWQGVDFWTKPSDGHVISYLAGAFLKRGLFVSKCATRGWVEDLLFNPHYSMRLEPSRLPHPQYNKDVFGKVIDYQRTYLEGIVFGRCAEEYVDRTFLYAARDGLAFRDDQGGSNARIINHGTDTGTYAIVVEASGDRGLEFINSQPNPLHNGHEMVGILTGPEFKGRARFYNSESWLRKVALTAWLKGEGEVLIQQAQANGLVKADAGRLSLENVLFRFSLNPVCLLSEKIAELEMVGNGTTGSLAPQNFMEKASAWGNQALPIYDPVIKPENIILQTGWEEGDRRDECVPANMATDGCGVKGVADAECAPSPAEAHSGKYSLRLAGQVKGGGAIAYFKITRDPIKIERDTIISYWFKPANPASCTAGLDLVLEDGHGMRDLHISTTEGEGTHPCAIRGEPGKWTRFVIPVGRQLAGRTIRAVLFAFDSHGVTGNFEAFMDDLIIANAK